MDKEKLASLSDERLMQMVAQNNELAFAIIFDRYWYDLLDTAARVLSDTAKAQDVVQEIFEDLWNRRATIKTQSLIAYLNKAAKYKSISTIRKYKIEYQELDGLSIISDNLNSEQQLQLKELSLEIDHAISELPEKCEKVFRMSRDLNLSNKEIASQLDISVRTVENHIAYALKILRSKYHSRASLLLILLLL